MKTKHLPIALGIVILGGFAYWGISPLFRNVELNEALPEGARDMPAAPSPAPSPAGPPQSGGPAKGTTFTSAAGASVLGTTAHPASGTVRLIEADGKTYLRYENYKTINGPDLFVYLAKDLDAKEFVNLGGLKGTEGNINYEVPSGVNVRNYPYVITWCRAFSVLFNYAKIN